MTITAATAATLRYEPIPVAYLDHVRTAGLDEAGNPLVVRVEDEGGHPLRCCLRDSRPGERVLLIAYTPPGGAGPYAERGPVFVHAEACEGYADVDVYPPGLRHRRQVVRAYDTHADMGDGGAGRRRGRGGARRRRAAGPTRGRGRACPQRRGRLLQLLRAPDSSQRPVAARRRGHVPARTVAG